MTAKTLKPIYTQSEALYETLENAKNAKDLEEIFSIILDYYREAENRDSNTPFDDAIKTYLHCYLFEALTEQTKEQIGLDIEIDYYV